MSTQPVPTFPVVAGLENYFGMTVEEVVDAVKDTNDFREIEPKVIPYDLDDPNYAWANEELEIASIEYHNYPQVIPFAVELDKFSTNTNNEMLLRKSAYFFATKLSAKIGLISKIK